MSQFRTITIALFVLGRRDDAAACGSRCVRRSCLPRAGHLGARCAPGCGNRTNTAAHHTPSVTRSVYPLVCLAVRNYTGAQSVSGLLGQALAPAGLGLALGTTAEGAAIPMVWLPEAVSAGRLAATDYADDLAVATMCVCAASHIQVWLVQTPAQSNRPRVLALGHETRARAAGANEGKPCWPE